MKLRLLAICVLLLGLQALASAAPVPLAWARFDSSRDAYMGQKYHFLGSGDLSLTIDVKPAPGQVLELLWGSKRDVRQALLVINGAAMPLPIAAATAPANADGFTWLRIPIPPAAIKGDRYAVTLRSRGPDAPIGSRPAFIAELRLTGDLPPNAPAPDLTARASRVTLISHQASADFLWNLPAFSGEAFPAMRPLWDRARAPASNASPTPDEALFRRAEANARRAAEAYYRCHKFVEGWLKYADPKTGLIPRNLKESRDFWNGRDSAADNYPFMVLTAAFTDRTLFEGRMLDMLRTETRLTSRLGRLCDNYSFSKQGWARPEVQLDEIIFDNVEYVKDGLIPLTEWLGPSPWSERMTGIIDDVWARAPIETPYGRIPTLNFEVNGDLLQACSRLYWFTGERKYLDWAIRLGDYYLLGDHHPTRTMTKLSLSDHACEVFNGLSELYVAVSKAEPQKAAAYRAPLRELYDRLLAIGRDPHGMLYTSIDPRAGTHSGGLTDCWGYNYDGFYTLHLIGGEPRYRDAVRQVLGNLKEYYTGQVWQGGSADGYADSIEGAINLNNRERLASAEDWIDSEIRTMWSKQHPDGIIEGWHGDGNFARTSIMYALMKSQGARLEPWREDVRLGAAVGGKGIVISLAADKPWTGRVIFDKPRHRVNMRLPLDYPRINQFPEWFTAEAGLAYTITSIQNAQPAASKTLPGQALQEGVEITLTPGQELRWRVAPAK